MLTSRRFAILVLSFVVGILFPSLACMAEELYDRPGFDPNRETYSLSDIEHIDPFTGGLIATFEDMRLPGNAGLDFVVQRTFNSKSICDTWLYSELTGCTTCAQQAKESWVGLGWTLHFGKLYKDNIDTGPDVHIIEMPDGSRHEAYPNVNSPNYITKDYWLLDASVSSPVLTLTDGTKIFFGHFAGVSDNNAYREYYATKIQDVFGNAIIIDYCEPDDSADSYDSYGAISNVVDSLGRTTQFQLTSATIGDIYRLDKIVRPDGKEVDFEYILDGPSQQVLLDKVVPPVGAPWNYDYEQGDTNTLHDLKSITTPHGGIISYTYDTAVLIFNGFERGFRVTETKTTSGRGVPPGTWTFEYFQGANHEYTIISDPDERQTKYRHYGYGSGLVSGNLWKIGLLRSREIIGADGTTQEKVDYAWEQSPMISEEDFRVHIWTDFSIHTAYLSSETITRDGKAYNTSYSDFDTYGNPRDIDETGDTDRTRSTTLTYWYDTDAYIVDGRPATKLVEGAPLAEFPDSFETIWTYDPGTGFLREVSRYGVITEYTPYANGNTETITDPNNKTTTYEWTNGRVSKITNPIYEISRVINTNGTVKSVTNGRGFTTSFEYDDNLRLKEITPPLRNPITYTIPPSNASVTEQRGSFSTIYYYDGLGRPSGSLNSVGIGTSNSYRPGGTLAAATSNVGDTVSYDYFGRIKKIIHKDNTSIVRTYTGNKLTITDEEYKQTELTYYSFGDPYEKYLFSVKDAADKTTSYSRNILGSLTEISQGGITRTFHYDTRNYLDWERHPETGMISYTRYNAGNVETRTDGRSTRTYEYDDLNRLEHVLVNGATLLSFGYDNADNLTSMTSAYSDVTYTFDDANALTDKTETILGVGYNTHYDYDDNDNLTGLIYPTGTSITYTPNTKNQITSVTGFGGSIPDVTYYTASTSLGLPWTFACSNGITSTLTYTPRNLIKRIDAPAALDIEYDYYNSGNVETITDHLEPVGLDRGIEPGFNDYVYNASTKRLSSVVGPNAATYDYDGDGALSSWSIGGVSYTNEYDDLGNLTSTRQGTTTVAEFGYDAGGQRVTKTAGGDTIVYHYDEGGALLSETTASGVRIADYIYLNGKLVARKTAEGAAFYHTDPAGTPVAMTDSAGTVIWKADYKPFGAETISIASGDNTRLFIGKQKDAETGLHYFGARYYDARIGRFTAIEPVRAVNGANSATNESLLLNPQGLNLYAYSLNNPYRHLDTDGELFWDILDVGFFCYSVYAFAKDPSLSTGFDLVLDTAGLLPVVPALGAANRGVKAASKAGDVLVAGKAADRTVAVSKSGTQIFSKGVGGQAKISLEQARAAAQKAGIDMRMFDLAYEPGKNFGFISQTGSGALWRAPNGKIVLTLQDVGLTSTEAAVETIAHELNHVRGILKTGIPTTETAAEAAAAAAGKHFR